MEQDAVAWLLHNTQELSELLSQATVRALDGSWARLHTGDLRVRKVLKYPYRQLSMHFAEIPSGFEFVNTIKSQLNAIERVRRARPKTAKILGKQYGLKHGEPTLVTTRRTRHPVQAVEEDFLFGHLDVFDYSTVVNGVHLQFIRPLSLHAEGPFIKDCKSVGRLWEPFYEHHEFAHASVQQGYRLACGRHQVYEVLAEFGLAIDHLLCIQEQTYSRTKGSC